MILWTKREIDLIEREIYEERRIISVSRWSFFPIQQCCSDLFLIKLPPRRGRFEDVVTWLKQWVCELRFSAKKQHIVAINTTHDNGHKYDPLPSSIINRILFMIPWWMISKWKLFWKNVERWTTHQHHLTKQLCQLFETIGKFFYLKQTVAVWEKMKCKRVREGSAISQPDQKTLFSGIECIEAIKRRHVPYVYIRT